MFSLYPKIDDLMRPTLLLITACLLHPCGLAQSYDYDQRYPVERLKADVLFMKQALEEAHPSLYWYTPKDSIDLVFAKAIRQISEPLTEREFYDLLRPAIAQVRCGHTSLMLSQQYDQWPDKPAMPFLPLDIFVDESQVFVTGNHSTDSTIRAGDELISINQIPVEVIIARAKAAQPADGYNETFKYHFLNWYLFKEVSWSLFGLKPPFQVELKSVTGNRRHSSITRKPKPIPPATSPAPLRESEQKQVAEKQRKAQQEADRNFRVLTGQPSAALLTVNGFGYEDAYEFHRNVFRQLRKQHIEHLIIDLRANPGGNIAYAVDLMSYLMDTSFVINRESWSKLPDPNQPSFAASFDNDRKQLLKENTKYLRSENGRHHYETVGLGWQQPKPTNRFQGKLYLLTSGFTFSAGSLFAASLKAQRSVTVVGEETGGGQAGCTAGIIQLLTLPNTQIRLRFPLFRITTASTQPNQGRGLMPDYPVHYTWQDKVAGKDLPLEKTLQLIQGKGKP